MNPKLTRPAWAAALLLFGSSHAGELKVEVHNVGGEDGRVMVAVYDSAEAWLKRPLRGLMLDARRGVVSGSFGEMPAGDYAVSVIHDLNRNGRLDSNALGIPTEPFAFSNNAAGTFGPAKFEQARVSIDAAGATVVLDLNPASGSK